MSNFLAKNVAPCTYIDSTKFSQPKQWSTLDGQHFTTAGYDAWAAAITQSIVNLPNIKQAKK
jgi:lysophospholipase L1-like esterase